MAKPLEAMPIILTSRSGTCGNCGQVWRASYPQFDIYCPNCGANVWRLGPLSRIGDAVGMAVVLLAFSTLLMAAASWLVGATLGFVVLGVGAGAAIATGIWIFRAARTHRTVASPLPRYARGLTRPGFD